MYNYKLITMPCKNLKYQNDSNVVCTSTREFCPKRYLPGRIGVNCWRPDNFYMKSQGFRADIDKAIRER